MDLEPMKYMCSCCSFHPVNNAAENNILFYERPAVRVVSEM